MALFNLLPLPRLDGSELLDVLLSAPTGFAPVLPLARESKLVGTVQNKVAKEGRLDGLLESMVAGLQGALVGGASSARGMGPSRRVKLVKAGIQVSVAALAGLYMLGTLYSQVLV